MRRLPTNLKSLRGTLRKDRANPCEVQPAPGIPPCPSYLSKEAKKEWHRLGAELVRLRMVSRLDSTLFAAYCASYGTWVEATERLALEGLTSETKNGVEQISCWWTIAKQAVEQMLRIGCEFGLTPVSRAKVPPLPGPPHVNKLDQFLKPATVTPIRGDVGDESA